MNLKLLLRENQLILDTVETGLVLLVALGLNLSADTQNWTVTVVIALMALVKGWSVKPFAPSLIVDFSRAVFMLVASFGVTFFTPDKTAVIVTFIGTVTSLLVSMRVTPTQDPIIAPTGAGAGPVSSGNNRAQLRVGDERGAADLIQIGWVLVAVWLLVFILSLVLAVPALLVGLAWILLVLGVILLLVGYLSGRRVG